MVNVSMEKEKDKRKNVKVDPLVKDMLGDAKMSLSLPSESHVLHYLLSLHRLTRDRVTVKEHDKMINDSLLLHKQIYLF